MKKLLLIALLPVIVQAREYGDIGRSEPGGLLMSEQQNQEARQYQMREYEARQAQQIQDQQQQIYQQQSRYSNDYQPRFNYSYPGN